jgi:hypothetical protein
MLTSTQTGEFICALLSEFAKLVRRVRQDASHSDRYLLPHCGAARISRIMRTRAGMEMAGVVMLIVETRGRLWLTASSSAAATEAASEAKPPREQSAGARG